MVKKAVKNDAHVEVNVENEENYRLQSMALDQGILSKTRHVAGNTLPPSNLMLKSGGKDITKRSSARRNRYLLVFNCQLAPAAAGRLGTLSRLDTKNPVMYIEFPEGRLRLRGALVFPKNKYIVLRLGNKEALCEDVMESMIVFSEAHWIGTAEENPEEVELPMPGSLKTPRHDKVDFGMRNADALGGPIEMDYDETQDEDIGDAAAGPSQPASQPSQRRASRHAATRKRQRYAEDSDASFDDPDEEEDEPAPKKLPRAPRRSSGGSGGAKAAKAKSPLKSHAVINLVDDSSDEEEEEETLATRANKKQNTLAPSGKRSAPASAAKSKSPIACTSYKKSSRKDDVSADDEEGNVIDLANTSDDEAGDDREEEEVEEILPLSQRPRRAAAGAASKKLQDGQASDDEGEASGSGEEESERDSDIELDDDSDDAVEASEEEEDDYAPSE